MSSRDAQPGVERLQPLRAFAEREGRPLPECIVVDGATVPEPYHRLLVHTGDMTSRLEAFHGDTLRLRVLACERSGDAYSREVLLCTAGSGMPVEYGAIQIDLAVLPESMRAEILKGERPLGGLLNASGMVYRSAPSAFLEVHPDCELLTHFHSTDSTPLYGRCNVLTTGDGCPFAKIVEILPP